MHGSRRALAIAAAIALLPLRSPAGASPLGGWLGLPQPLESVQSGIGALFNHNAPLAVSDKPHPAVARIIVPEGNTAISYGSGTLVDVRDQFGLVVTNWHVVRDGTGEVEVVFPDGFKSKARPLKVDSDWDLAALVIWRPPVAPVQIAASAPQPGDVLTICGYGSGQYRAATGRCTQYYSPSMDLPQHMVELDVEARQGDSGGPILNDRGELAGVLFGAGRGTTLGSFGGRVESFLVSLAPDIGRGSAAQLTDDSTSPTRSPLESSSVAQEGPLSANSLKRVPAATLTPVAAHEPVTPPSPVDRNQAPSIPANGWRAVNVPADKPPAAITAIPASTPTNNLVDYAKNGLAAVGVLALIVQALRLAR